LEDQALFFGRKFLENNLADSIRPTSLLLFSRTTDYKMSIKAQSRLLVRSYLYKTIECLDNHGCADLPITGREGNPNIALSLKVVVLALLLLFANKGSFTLVPMPYNKAD